MSLYSSASDFAKDQWLDKYTDQLSHSEGSVLQLLGLNTDSRVKMEGRNTYMKIQVGDDLGFGMVPTIGGDFPTPGDISSDEATLTLKRFADTIKFDPWEMELLNSLDAAAAPIMAKKMSASRMRVLRELERQAIMDGTGAIAKVASVLGTALTLDVAGSAYTERNPYTWIDDPNRSGYRIIDPTDGTDQLTTPARFTISAINESTNVLTCSATLTGAAAADVVVVDAGQYGFSNSAHTTYTSPEYVGLLGAIASTGTYLGIDRSTVPQWQATVLSNSGTLRDITDNLVDQLMNKTARRSENGSIVPSQYVGLADPGTWTSYHNLMRTGLRYSISDNPDIGWGGRAYLSMDGVPLYKHINAPRHQIMLVHKNSIGFVGPKFGTSSIVKYVEQGGSIFFQANASTGSGYADETYCMIAGFIGMYTDRPRNHSRLDDLNLTAPAYDGQ